MRWKDESVRPIIIDTLSAMEIACDAYYEGYINWNVYQKVLDRINTKKNGSGMFEQNEVMINYERHLSHYLELRNNKFELTDEERYD
jgi:hypothetical protein